MDKHPTPTYYFPTMASDRIQRRIGILLDEADEAFAQGDWETVQQRSHDTLTLDPDNQEALTFLAAAERALGSSALPSTTPTPTTSAPTPSQPTSFADGRYQVKQFLGEGGKKRVYLAHDTTLDREVAFALIKTEGLDETSRTRIQREAQAMAAPMPTSSPSSTLAKKMASPTWSLNSWAAATWKGLLKTPKTIACPWNKQSR